MTVEDNTKKGSGKITWQRALKWSAIGAAIYALVGFLALPPLARHFGAKTLTELLGRTTTIESIRFNPFLLDVTVREFRIAEAEGDAAAFSADLLYADLELASLVRGGPVLREIKVENPALTVLRLPDDRLSWSDVVERLAGRPASDDAEPALFSLNNIQLSGGTVNFDDRLAGVRHEVTALALRVPFLSNLPVKIDLFVEPELSALINGQALRVTGRTRPFRSERDTVIDLQLQDFDITPYLAYVPGEKRFSIPEGRLTSALEVSFSQPPEARPEVALKGSIELSALRLHDAQDTPLVSLPRLALAFSDLQPLVGRWHFDSLALTGPEVNLVREAGGALNLASLAPPPPANDEVAKETLEAPDEGDAPAPSFALGQLRVDGAVLRFEDRTVSDPKGSPFRAELRDVTLAADGLATADGAQASVKLAFTSDAAEAFAHEGELRLTPLSAHGKLSVEGVKVPRYAAYYGSALPAGEIRSGVIGAALAYRFEAGGDAPKIEIDAERVKVGDFELALKGQKQPAVSLARLELGAVAVRPGERSVAIGTLDVGGAAVSVVRGRNGLIDLAQLASPKTTPEAKGESPAKTSSANDATWQVALKRFAVADSRLRFEDRTQERPIVMLAEQIRVSGADFSTAKGTSTGLDFSARINKRGRAEVKGSLAIEPLKGDFRLNLSDVDLLPLQPYVAEQLNVSISRGRLSSRSALQFEQRRENLRARFRGDLRVSDFASIDKLQAVDFVRWQQLAVGGIDVRTEPFSLAIGEIALDDFYTRLILDEEGQLNLREIRADSAPAEPAPVAESVAAGEAQTTLPPPEPAPPINVDKIRISGGNIAFSDRFIRPNYDANLTGMAGELVGLSSDPSSIAKLDLKGQVDGAAPVTVVGELNPFRQDRYLKIAAAVKDFELTGISAYSGKYVGYGIEKGKLSAELNYNIENRALSATNRIFLDQLTFGEQVDSPDAVNLPVRLAVSLLKNRQGEIDLNVPVSGSLDDPQFSIGGLVIKAILNLIGKAITSPFALLGSVFGGGAELSYIEFAPGRTDFHPQAQEKLATLARALADRPGLKLEIAAHADPEADPDGIRRVLLEQQVKAAWIKEHVRKGEEVPSLDDLQLAPEQYEEMLREVYGDADFKRPRNAIGLLKDLPVPEMEALMLAHIEVTDAALQQLAQRRGQAVRDKLVGEGGIASERIFLLGAKVKSGGDGDQAGAGRRAEFSLK